MYLWPNNALLELDWSLVGLWMVCLMAVAEVIGRGESPPRVSVAGGRSPKGLRNVR